MTRPVRFPAWGGPHGPLARIPSRIATATTWTSAVIGGVLVPLVAAADGLPRIPKTAAAVERQLARAAVSAEAAGAFEAATPAQPGGGYRLDVVINTPAPELAERMRATGARVHALSTRFRRAAVTVPSARAVRSLAALAPVAMIYPAYGSVTSVGEATSRAPKALRVDGGQSTAGFATASGEKIGILSDSFARTSGVRDLDTSPEACQSGTLTGSKPQDSGDLPDEVEILADDFASGSCPGADGAVDEGAAMAELIHDMAPEAALSFHTVGDFRVAFAQAIDELCNDAGATAVVDDVIFFAESMYQRGPIAQAAEDCVAAGVPYVSAAGNGADNALRRDYTDLDPNNNIESPSTSNDGPSDRASAVDAADLHDFGGTDPGVVEVQLPAAGRLLAVLQWNQPALSVPGNASNGPRIDLDLLALDAPTADPSNLVTDSAGNALSSFEDQAYEDGGGGADPTEIVSIANASASATSLYLAVDHWAGSRSTIPQSGSTDLEFRLVLFELAGDATIPYVDDSGGDSTMYGHRTGKGVISVAAVPWWDTPEFDTGLGPTNGIDPRAFSARGGKLPIHFARDGSFIGDQTRRHPRLTAVDGNNTTFFGRDVNLNAFGEPDSFPNFPGTSAAAPNAAAVIAGILGKSAERLAPSKVERLIRSNAVDVAGERAGSGNDDVTGAGLVDAKATLDLFPNAQAAAPAEVDLSATDIQLDGTASSANASIQSFAWRQIDGPQVTLEGADTAQPAFDAPAVPGTLVFELVVTGANGLTDATTVEVDVVQNLEFSGSSGDGGGGALGLGWLGLMIPTAYLALRRCFGLACA